MNEKVQNETFKLRCDMRFQRAFTACRFVFKITTLFGSNQSIYFENATACSKRTLKMHVATQLFLLKWKLITMLILLKKYSKKAN